MRRRALTATLTAAIVGFAALPALADTPAAETHGKGHCNETRSHQRDRSGRIDDVDGWWIYSGSTVGASSNATFAYVEVRDDNTVGAAARWPYDGSINGTPMHGVDAGVDTSDSMPVCVIPPAG